LGHELQCAQIERHIPREALLIFKTVPARASVSWMRLFMSDACPPLAGCARSLPGAKSSGGSNRRTPGPSPWRPMRPFPKRSSYGVPRIISVLSAFGRCVTHRPIARMMRFAGRPGVVAKPPSQTTVPLGMSVPIVRW